MRHKLHFAGNMHLVWEAVELFENTIYVVHTQILKNEDYNTQLLNLNIVYITCKIVTHLNVWAAVYTSQILEKKTHTCFSCLNVEIDLNFALQ